MSDEKSGVGVGEVERTVSNCSPPSIILLPSAVPENVPLAIRFKRFLFRSLIVLAAMSATSWGTYTYLWAQAEPFTPPVGTIFPREPVLVGTYQWINGPGGRNFITRVGETQVFCSAFSYYGATWFDPGSYFDCGRKEELHGKQVEVHRVRVPKKDHESHSLVINIVSEGRVYLDLTDAQIREKWISDTKQAGWFSKGLILLMGLVGGIFGCFGVNWSKKIIKGESV